MRFTLGLITSSMLVIAGVMVGLVSAEPASATVSATSFDAGNIISDSEFYQGNSLSASQVQSFLNDQVKTCRIGTSPYLPGSPSPSGSGNIIASACLKDFAMETQSRSANQYCGAYVGLPRESAAQIIAKVGSSCGISPKVLLVMLEKEQSLVSDTWPVTRQYNFAMGWACPDSGPNGSANCDPTASGFFQQVYRSAWQLKVYRAEPSSFRYKPFQTNTIQWHPNAGCGTSQVYISNWATAALYIYTPYRPNQAALNAGWGTGDGCSSYGNRNFFLFFNSWFPSSQNRPPIGDMQSNAGVVNGKLRVSGWAIDPESASPVTVTLSVGGNVVAETVASIKREDVGQVFPAYGPNHGFAFEIDATVFSGRQNVCVTALDLTGGASAQLECQSVDFGPKLPDSGRPPIGDMQSGTGFVAGMLQTSGWAIDPETASPIKVRLMVDGKQIAEKIADLPRPDVAQVLPAYGPNHGFQFVVEPVGLSGRLAVCVAGVDPVSSRSFELECQTVDFGPAGLEFGGQANESALNFPESSYS